MPSNDPVRGVGLFHREGLTGPVVSGDDFSMEASVRVSDSSQAQIDADHAEEVDRRMSLWSALKLWWPAALFSCAISTAMIMEGYDNLLLAQLYAFPAFRLQYGESTGTNRDYEIPVVWQSALSIGTLIGEVVGLLVNGVAIERFGYKKTMAIALLTVSSFIFVLFFAKSLIMILIGEFLCGIPWGAFQALTCAYVSDICPAKLRSYFTTYSNICWVIGQLIGSGVLRALVGRPDEWSYRIPFAIQWFWPIPIAVALIFAPESPWWLVRRGRKNDAHKALRALTDLRFAPEYFSTEGTLAMISVTNDMEKSQSTGANYLDCFKGVNKRRTEISCVTWVIQNICGSALMSYSTYFFVQAGLPTLMAFNLSLVQYGIGLGGTFVSWWLMHHFGRRTIFASGLLALTIILFVIGSVSLTVGTISSWTVGALLIVYAAAFNCTVGPITYSLVSEIPSTRMKNKTIVIARNLYNIAGIFNFVLVPNMLNPGAWGWGGKCGFFWAGICVFCLVWSYFRLPEPKDRSFSELDELFEKEVSARKFSTTVLKTPGRAQNSLGMG